MGSGYLIRVRNSSNVLQTLSRVTGADTIDGTAANVSMPPKSALFLAVNSTTNGYLTIGRTGPFLDSDVIATGSSDGTKKVRLEVDGLTTDTTRVVTVPDRNITIGDLSPITASLGADVTLNNTGTYFDGPSVAQGTSGTWFVSGTVTVFDTGAASTFSVKLWDGTTVIASCQGVSESASHPLSLSLSGFIASPAGNLRISVKDISATTGKILFNQSGNSKDSTITAIRVA